MIAKVSSRCSQYFLAAMVSRGGTPTWRPRTELCKLVQNISSSVWSLGKRTDLKLGELSPLSISYNITISQLYPLNDFRIIFLSCDSAIEEFVEQGKECVHCHAIKNKIKNYAVDRVKKLWYYSRQIKKAVLQVCVAPRLRYSSKCSAQNYR